MKKFILIAIVIIVIMGLVFVFTPIRPPRAPEGPTVLPPEPSLPAVTGNVDDAVDDILADLSADEPSAAENDSSLTAEDDRALSDFGQSFDATQF